MKQKISSYGYEVIYMVEELLREMRKMQGILVGVHERAVTPRGKATMVTIGGVRQPLRARGGNEPVEI